MRSLAILLLTVTFVAHFCLNMAFSSFKESACPKKCRLNYEPVCGIRFGSDLPNHCTFNNICVLILYICQTKQRWLTMSVEPCDDHSRQCHEIINFYKNRSDLIIRDNGPFEKFKLIKNTNK